MFKEMAEIRRHDWWAALALDARTALRRVRQHGRLCEDTDSLPVEG